MSLMSPHGLLEASRVQQSRKQYSNKPTETKWVTQAQYGAARVKQSLKKFFPVKNLPR